LIKEPDGKDYNYRLADEPSNPDLTLLNILDFLFTNDQSDLQEEANQAWFY
jgi:hypothetical protein